MYAFQNHTRRLLMIGWCILYLLIVVGCTNSSTPATSTPSPAAKQPVVTTPTPDPIPTTSSTCPTKPLNQTGGIPEVQGESQNAELWALFFFTNTSQLIYAKQELKIVWRMTGSGDFSIVARNARGNEISPSWGPVTHSSSS